MGYILRLGKVSKKDYIDFYKDKSLEEIKSLIQKDDNYIPFAKPPHYKQLFSLGKWVDYKYDCNDFYSFNVKDFEYDFWIMSKSGLKKIIKDYHKNTYEWYVELSKCFELIEKEETPKGIKKDCSDSIYSYFYGKVQEWEGISDTVKKPYKIDPYFLDQKNTDGFIVSSWKIEYAIFNLVYIYRTFDWENDLLIYSGW